MSKKIITTTIFWAMFEADFIKYWLGWWTLARSIPRIPREWALNYIRQAYSKTHKVTYFLPLSSWEQAYILMYFLPTYLSLVCKQAHPLQLRTTNLIYGIENTWIFILHKQTAPTIPGSYLSLGKWAYRLEALLLLLLLLFWFGVGGVAGCVLLPS